jgi:hypothetical protein
MKLGVLKHGSRVAASRRFNKVFKVPALSFHAGIERDTLLRLHFFPPRLIWAVYHDLLRNDLPELLQDVDLQSRIY